MVAGSPLDGTGVSALFANLQLQFVEKLTSSARFLIGWECGLNRFAQVRNPLFQVRRSRRRHERAVDKPFVGVTWSVGESHIKCEHLTPPVVSIQIPAQCLLWPSAHVISQITRGKKFLEG